MIFIGVDPGKSGALGWIENEKYGAFKFNDKTDRDIWDIFDFFKAKNVFAFLEQVHSMPGQGVSSTFKFGESYGFLRCCLVGNRIPFKTVTPTKWQKLIGCMIPKPYTITDKKNHHKGVAQSLFPKQKITHANADALLIAAYCRMVMSNAQD
jgi:hypothetical protein